MTALNSVLEVMHTQPDREWTPALVSVPLNADPRLIAGRMRTLNAQERIKRIRDGVYCLPQRQVQPTDQVEVTALMKAQVYGALKQYGQPLPGSSVLERVKRHGFDMPAVQATLTQLIGGGLVVRLPDGKYSAVRRGQA